MAIERNRTALLRLLSLLFATAGLVAGAMGPRVPRQVWRRSLAVLRPAEAAARRLIVIVARGLELRPAPPRPCPAVIPRGKAERARMPRFQLFDPLRRVGVFVPRVAASAAPRIRLIGDPASDIRTPPSATEITDLDATRLCRRMTALQDALHNLPAQAQRLARWRARRDKARPGRVSPLRSGRPPGHRARARHEVDEVLRDCHTLALWALMPPDTS